MQFIPLELDLHALQTDGDTIDIPADMPLELTTADTVIFNGWTNWEDFGTDSIAYLWTVTDENGNTVATHHSGEFAFHHTVPGTYTISCLADQGCYSTMESFEVNIEQAVSTTELQPESTFTLYPNPTNGTFTLKAPPEFTNKITSYQLYNTNGQLILEKDYTGEQIDISHLPSGTYFLQISVEGGQTNSSTIPIIKN